MHGLDVSIKELVICAFLAWLFFRYSGVMISLAFFCSGLLALLLLPVDIWYNLFAFALMGLGLGLLLYRYHLRCDTLHQ